MTRQEQRIVILICVLITISIAIISIKRFNPEWFLRASLGQPDIDMRKDQAERQSKIVQPSETSKPSKITKLQETKTTSDVQAPSQKEKSKEMVIKKINVNTATLDELIQLPGIGEVKAKNIIDYRNKNGYFTDIDDLINVSGIGEKTLDKIRDFITVGEEKNNKVNPNSKSDKK